MALTTSTSEGMGKILAGMDLGPGDEIITSDDEHPGLLGPLLAAKQLGVTVRAVPFAQLADAVGPPPPRSPARTSTGTPASWRPRRSPTSTCR